MSHKDGETQDVSSNHERINQSKIAIDYFNWKLKGNLKDGKF